MICIMKVTVLIDTELIILMVAGLWQSLDLCIEQLGGGSKNVGVTQVNHI